MCVSLGTHLSCLWVCASTHFLYRSCINQRWANSRPSLVVTHTFHIPKCGASPHALFCCLSFHTSLSSVCLAGVLPTQTTLKPQEAVRLALPKHWLPHLQCLWQHPWTWSFPVVPHVRSAPFSLTEPSRMCPWRGHWGTILSFLCFLAAMKWAASATTCSCVHDVLPSHRPKPWGHMSTYWNPWNHEPKSTFPPLSCFSKVFGHHNQKLTDAASMP
jgi:hypothetical protein